MSHEIVAQGTGKSLLALASYETQFAEGDAGTLEINMRWIPAGIVDLMNKRIKNTPGGQNVDLSASSGTVRVEWVKTFGPLALIAGILGIFFVGAILLLVTGWVLFREPFAKAIEAGAELAQAAADIGSGIGENLDKLIPAVAILAGLFLLFQWQKKGK